MKKSALLCILGAGVLWGCMGVFVRTLQNEFGFGSLEIVCMRLTVAAIAFVVTALFRKTLSIKLCDVPILFCMGFFGIMLLSVTYFLSMTYSSLAVAAILMYTAPAFVLAGSVVLFKEKLTVGKIVSIILAFAGCVLVSGISKEEKGAGAVGVIMGLLSGITYGSYSIFGTYALKKYDSYTATTWAFIFAALTSLAICNAGGIAVKIVSNEFPLKIIALAVGMGIFTAYMPFLLYTIGLSKTLASKAIIIASVEPLVAAVLGFALYGESLTVFSLVGIASILASVALTALRN